MTFLFFFQLQNPREERIYLSRYNIFRRKKQQRKVHFLKYFKISYTRAKFNSTKIREKYE